MPKYTLLEMTQSILSDMDSDEVNSISDTIESLQVVQIIKDTFYNIVGTKHLPNQDSLFSLTPAADTDFPTHFTIPDNVLKVEWIRYDSRGTVGAKKAYTDMTYKTQAEFIDLVHSRDSTDSSVQTVTESSVDLFIKNDIAPSFYTSFDDSTLIFDAFDSDIDTTLQASKLISFGETEATWSTTNSFTPAMPTRGFQYLLAEAKSNCFIKLKQEASQKDEIESRRQRNKLSRAKNTTGSSDFFPNYGRK